MPAVNTVHVLPNDSMIRYTGRVHVTASAAYFDWADVQIEFRTDANQVELLFNDPRNDYNLFIDGRFAKVLTSTAAKVSHLVTLGAGDHHVTITKRTGPNFGSGQFLGMKLPSDAQLIALPPAPNRRIEFIGDSWTVGYGNEGPGLNCGGVLRPYENSYLSFAPITARTLNAQSHSIAISGFGAVRNYGDANSTSPKPMPLYYNRTLMEREDLLWNFQSWVPNAVVIKLGTNDHSTQPEPSAEMFIQGIHGLVKQVTTAYGRVPIFLVADDSLPQVVARMQSATQQQRDQGNNQVYFVQLTSPPQSQLGCDWHPLVMAHEAMADELITAIKPVLGW